MRVALPLPLAALILLLAGCSNDAGTPSAAASTTGDSAAMKLSTTAFGNGQPIPDQYTCHGADISPPLQWSAPPPNAKSIALTCEDPDAPGGTFTHWVLFNLPPASRGLVENVTKTDTLPDGSHQGRNSFGNIGYNGPCPPGGQLHHYIFRIYALDAMLSLDAGAVREDLLKAMRGHIVAQGEYTGTCRD